MKKMEKNNKGEIGKQEEKDMISADLKEAVEVMRKGGIILYPTDTVWGIGCDATNPEAVKKIYDLKERSDSKSMLVLVDSPGMLERYVEDIPDVAWQLMEAAVDPLTIIYDHPKGLAPELQASDGSTGFRITQEKFSMELCRRLRKPIVSTSANKAGNKTPQTFSEIPEEIKQGVDYVVNYRRDDNQKHTPSNIIKLSEGGLVKIIR